MTCLDTLTSRIAEALSASNPNEAIQVLFNTAGEFTDPANCEIFTC
ncbi:MAG: hypothetical protein HC912_08490 [Saprospiraceae bacterium]|nr:hypothetical protein [Saprospiraceae bacterium]